MSAANTKFLFDLQGSRAQTIVMIASRGPPALHFQAKGYRPVRQRVLASKLPKSQEWMSLKEVAVMKSMLASTAVVVTLCAAPAVSAEFPKTGEAEYDSYYVDNVLAEIDSEAGTGGIVEETGITRNVKGEGPFHDMSVRCLYHWSVALLALFGHPPALRNVRYRG